MATSRIIVVPPICQGQPAKILVDDMLGGGGAMQDYYISWFKEGNPGTPYTYNIPNECPTFPAGYTLKAQIGLPSPTATATQFQISPPAFSSTPVVYLGLPVNRTFIENYITAALSAVASRIISVSGNVMTVFMLPTDPDAANVVPGVVFTKSGGDGVFNSALTTVVCPVTLSTTIEGWIPAAQGYNMWEYVTPGPGKYLVEIRDKAGTVNYAVIEITEVSPLKCNIEKKDVSCFGANDGELCAIDPIDDSGSIGYEWYYTPPNLPPAQICYDEEGSVITCDPLYVTDSLCWQRRVQLTTCNGEPQSPPTCFDRDGNIVTCPPEVVEDGCYRVLWSPIVCPGSLTLISTDKCIKGLAPGTYCLKMTNAKGCSITCCTTITEPVPFVVSILEQLDPACASCKDGSQYGYVQLGVTGGNRDCAEFEKSPYQYSINGGEWKYFDYDDKVYIMNLLEGVYKIRVKDCKCCITSTTITLVQPRITT